MKLGFWIPILAIIAMSCGEEVVEHEIPVDETHGATPNANLEVEVPVEMYHEIALQPSEYVKWMKSLESGLPKVKTLQDIEFTAYPLSPEFMACNDLRENNVDQQLWDSTIVNYRGMKYFMLRIDALNFGDELAKYQLQSQAEYQERIMYLSFEQQGNLSVQTDDGRDVPCVLYHFERTYGVTPYSTFMLGFDEASLEGAKELTLTLDDQLFDKGLVKFTWSTEVLKNIPKVEVGQAL